jgi:CHAT domain-containing protein
LDKLRKADPEQASLMTVEPLTLKQVQALLEPGQTLVEYLVTPSKTYLWMVDKRRSQSLEISISRKELARNIEALRTAISEVRPLAEYQRIARDLYEQLVRPATSFVGGKELVIVPHDILHYLPFQALYAAKGNYLLEDYSVTYLSSASLLQFTTAKRKTMGQKVLAIGNPDLEGSRAQLPMAELEAKEIRKTYPEATVLVGDRATEQTIRDVSPVYDVLHFATHAELRKDDPLSSAILLSQTGGDDGRLETKEIFGMDLKAGLVVLSGCETGLGTLSGGDELIGLTRAFIYAGTPSVVASLWKVDDASTSRLMGNFYRNLKTLSKTEALRLAQLAMIRGVVSGDSLAKRGVGGIAKLGHAPLAASQSDNAISTSHPYFWAPFILVGDGK